MSSLMRPNCSSGSPHQLRTCGRALIFGDNATTQQYANNPAIQIHGPGWSKILVGNDCVENWRDYIDVMAASISRGFHVKSGAGARKPLGN